MEMECASKQPILLDWMDTHILYKIIQYLSVVDTQHLLSLLLSRTRSAQLRADDAFYQALCISNLFLHDELISDKKPSTMSFKDYFYESISTAKFYRQTFEKLIQVVPKNEGNYTQEQVDQVFKSDESDLKSILAMVKAHYKHIPRDVLILYRTLNGQEKLSQLSDSFLTTVGLFGLVYYYNTYFLFFYNTFMPPACGFLGKLRAHQFSKVFPEGKSLFLDITNIFKQPKPSLYSFFPKNGANGKYYLYIAHGSIDSFMRKMNNTYLKDGHIQLVNTLTGSGSDTITNGIRIRATAYHAYMDLHNSVDEFFYTYTVRISVDEATFPDGKKYKLTTRKWIIINDAEPEKEEVVEGPGVIGHYPEMYKGCEDFVYESCTIAKGHTGLMKGSFQFRELGTNNTFDAIIGTFALRPDSDAKLVQLSVESGDVQQIYPAL